MDEAENTGTGVNTHPPDNYHSTPFSSVRNSIMYLNDKKQLRKALPSHSKNLRFQSFRRNGMSRTNEDMNHINNFYSKGFTYQYYSVSRDKNSFSRLLNLNASVKFRKRNLLSILQKNKTIRQPSYNHKRRRRKSRNTTNIKEKITGTRNQHISETVPENSSTNISNSSKVNLEKLALKELKEYEEFVTLMQQTFSKDPLRAMLSIAFLMTLLMVAIKLCGMKPTRRHQEMHPDLQDEVHYVGIHDILKRKRPYLPKYLLSWERRLRRKFKRRQKIRKAWEQQQQLVAPASDNSEEENLIYGGNYDF